MRCISGAVYWVVLLSKTFLLGTRFCNQFGVKKIFVSNYLSTKIELCSKIFKIAMY